MRVCGSRPRLPPWGVPSFFDYFASKSDILWAGPDERIEAFEEHLETLDGPDAAAEVRGATIAPAEDFAPDDLQVTLFQELGPV